jgi:hypothetical protein
VGVVGGSREESASNPGAGSEPASLVLVQSERKAAPLLPSFDEMHRSSMLANQSSTAAPKRRSTSRTEAKSKGAGAEEGAATPALLSREFFRFYASFDWSQGVSIRGPCNSRFASLNAKKGLVVRDPFDLSRNLAAYVSEEGRLKEELSRADGLCSQYASLTKLLEPWAPPDADALVSRETHSFSESPRASKFGFLSQATPTSLAPTPTAASKPGLLSNATPMTLGPKCGLRMRMWRSWMAPRTTRSSGSCV